MKALIPFIILKTVLFHPTANAQITHKSKYEVGSSLKSKPSTQMLVYMASSISVQVKMNQSYLNILDQCFIYLGIRVPLVREITVGMMSYCISFLSRMLSNHPQSFLKGSSISKLRSLSCLPEGNEKQTASQGNMEYSIWHISVASYII